MTLEEELRATAVAHAIRLGKPPKPGMVMSGKLTTEEIDESDWHAGRIEKAVSVDEPHRIEFTVTEADLRNAVTLINQQRAVFRSPKTTTLEVGPDAKERAIAAAREFASKQGASNE